MAKDWPMEGFFQKRLQVNPASDLEEPAWCHGIRDLLQNDQAPWDDNPEQIPITRVNSGKNISGEWVWSDKYWQVEWVTGCEFCWELWNHVLYRVPAILERHSGCFVVQGEKTTMKYQNHDGNKHRKMSHNDHFKNTDHHHHHHQSTRVTRITVY